MAAILPLTNELLDEAAYQTLPIVMANTVPRQFKGIKGCLV